MITIPLWLSTARPVHDFISETLSNPLPGRCAVLDPSRTLLEHRPNAKHNRLQPNAGDCQPTAPDAYRNQRLPVDPVATLDPSGRQPTTDHRQRTDCKITDRPADPVPALITVPGSEG